MELEKALEIVKQTRDPTQNPMQVYTRPRGNRHSVGLRIPHHRGGVESPGPGSRTPPRALNFAGRSG